MFSEIHKYFSVVGGFAASGGWRRAAPSGTSPCAPAVARGQSQGRHSQMCISGTSGGPRCGECARRGETCSRHPLRDPAERRGRAILRSPGQRGCEKWTEEQRERTGTGLAGCGGGRGGDVKGASRLLAWGSQGCHPAT